MSARSVHVIDTGCSNRASLLAALARAGYATSLTREAQQVAEAQAVVLPGVGSFGDALASLRVGGLAEALAERVTQDRPTLAICVGLQVLAQSSEESPGIGGLGLVEGRLQAFPSTVRVPQIGWNQLYRSRPSAAMHSIGEAYFVNSYRLTEAPSGWECLWSEHGGPFLAAIRRGRVLGCQFHPEISGSFGAQLLDDWLGLSFSAGSAQCC